MFPMNPVNLPEKRICGPFLLWCEYMLRGQGGGQYLRETLGHDSGLIPLLREADGSPPQALPQEGVFLERKNCFRQPLGITGPAEIDVSSVLQGFILLLLR